MALPSKNNFLAHLRSLFFRILCKFYEIFLRTVSGLRTPKDHDPTQLLLDLFTPEQKRLAASRPTVSPPESIQGPVKVAVIVPFRDRWDLTKSCLESLFAQKLGDIDVQLLLVDNGSHEPHTLAGLRQITSNLPPRFQAETLRIDAPFNYSRLNNMAVARVKPAAPDFLLFLNNDVELTDPDSLSDLVRFGRADALLGALGCTLRYPDGRIQHLFVAPGVKIVAAHPLKGLFLEKSAAWFQEPRPVAAVTGAVLMIPFAAFERVGGFDERLPTVGQDVDICLRLRALGYSCWALGDVQAVHKEGATRLSKIDRGEVEYFYDKWGSTILEDACYSTRLSRWVEMPVFRWIEGAYPWSKVLP